MEFKLGRWYCQMSQKQFREENGFSGHLVANSSVTVLFTVFTDSVDTYAGEYFKKKLLRLVQSISN